MDEPEVLRKVHGYLQRTLVAGYSLVRLYTDAHASLLPHRDLAPFQRFVLDFGDFVMHPDMLGQLADGETLLAIEAKGATGVLSGLSQAEMYQSGVQLSFLAAPAESLGASLVEAARRKGVGLLAVGEDVTTVYLPEARLPIQARYRSLMRQMETVVYVTEGGTFHYNIPTHYFVWPIILRGNTEYGVSELPDLLRGYPLPKSVTSALRGAMKLGLVQASGGTVRLTDIGLAVKSLLPSQVEQWTRIHEEVGGRGSRKRLCDECPPAGACLRLLLFHDPIVRIVVEGLRQFPRHAASFSELAVACDRLDHARTPIFFLKPESAAALTDDQGRVAWQQARSVDYRSTTFYQYKSILKHAGILAMGRLGGPTVRGYQPSRDMWQLSEGL